VLGVSRERVRQIVNQRNLTLNAKQPNTLISWPCPGCGDEVSMWTATRNLRRTVYCKSCSAFYRPNKLIPLDLECSIPDCPELRRARGYCINHWKRWRRHGDPLGGGPSKLRPKRFCSETGCPRRHYARSLCRSHYDLSKYVRSREL